jgi:SAM-dependent methyltransferase
MADPAGSTDRRPESATPFKDHFSSHAERYAAHRPTYPAALVDYLAGVAPALDIALDCGCGTGQLSVPLAARFARVVATDASAAQIQNAEAHPRVEYRTAPAERSGLRDASADLITVAQAAHWLDLDRFYDEARRVARPGGALAMISYGVVEVEGRPDAVVHRFYYDIIGSYWPPERRHVDAGYRTLPFPFPELDPPRLAIEVSWSLPDFIGYVDTWSAVRAAEQQVGREMIDVFFRDLAEAWGDSATRRGVRWPLAVRVGTL